MITVTPQFTAAINADTRYIKPRVEFYFDGDGNPPVVFDEDEITSINLLEESRAESGNPIGLVSANEVTISLNNSSRVFTPTNTSSPYYDKLRPKVKVKPYLRVRTATDPEVWEEIPLGVFRTGDWSAQASSIEATVTCYDRLYDLVEKDIPMIPVKKDTTVKAMFEALFSALGLAPVEYDVDASLTQAIGRGWFDNNKVRDGLNALAVAGNCDVTMSRYDIVRVRPNVVSGDAVAIFTDDNQIVSGDNPQRYLETYSAVKVKYRVPFTKASDVVLKIEDLTIQTGTTTLTPLSFTTGPVMTINQVKLTGAVNSKVTDISHGAWTMTVVIENTGVAETVTLEVFSQAIDAVGAEYTETDPGALFDKTLTIENSLIQSEAAAQAYAQGLLNYVKDPSATFSFNIRGNPAIELIDILRVLDPADKIPDVKVVPTRLQLQYDGALSGQMEARKV
ncbi:MAG: hypothetical protein A4E53_02143 [Pelotomaculum sp. PtaB.Bin104]|nr:MAG: hypothetical protein A4E53_02143 [Pelotomaculum sp. PtaB.Bin104]